MSISSFIFNQELAGLLITIAVQAILVSILGIAVIKLLSKRSAPVRSLVCTGVITALGLVLVISMGFRLYDISWTRPILPDLPGGSGVNSISFSEPDILLPVETISFTNPPQSGSSLDKDMIYSETITSPRSGRLSLLLIPVINFMGLVWLTGFLFQLLRLGYGFVLVKRFRDSLPGVPDSSFNEMVRNVAGVFWKDHIPDLYISSQIESPITIGIIKPVVIIPEKLLKALSENELKSILLHELAHIRHRDQVIGVIKRIVLTVHWWNPLVYLINREHEQAREEVSDNYVLQELHPWVYTQCLADLAEKVCLISNFPTAVGMAGGCFNLRTRVEHILSNKRRVAMRTKFHLKTIVFTSCLVLTFGISGLHGKSKSVKPGDAVAEEQKDISTINPVSLFEEGQKLLQKKATEFETIDTQDEYDSGIISNTGTTLRTASSDKQVLKNASPAIFMARTGTQTAKTPQEKTEYIKTVRENVLSNSTEDSTVVAQKKPAVKISSDAATVPETRAVEMNPEDAAAYYNRGNAYYRQGRFGDAISDYNEAIEMDPGFAAAYRNRGSAYYRQDRLDDAISDYNKAIEINPEDAVVYYNRGTVYLTIAMTPVDYHKVMSEYDKAISDFNKAIEMDPGFAAAYCSRGDAYYTKRRFRKAITDFSKVIELTPEDAAAYQKRGNAYFAKDKYPFAISDFSKAIELSPENAAAYCSRGDAYYTKRRFDKALSDYSKAIEVNPDYAGAYIKRGRLYQFTREYEKAVSDYNRAIELNPWDDVTKKRQEYALAREQWLPINYHISHIFYWKEQEPAAPAIWGDTQGGQFIYDRFGSPPQPPQASKPPIVGIIGR